LNRFKEGKAQRNAAGKITKAAAYQSRDVPTARVEPNRYVLHILVLFQNCYD
jgi:nuclear GTP-binding protein